MTRVHVMHTRCAQHAKVSAQGQPCASSKAEKQGCTRFCIIVEDSMSSMYFIHNLELAKYTTSFYKKLFLRSEESLEDTESLAENFNTFCIDIAQWLHFEKIRCCVAQGCPLGRELPDHTLRSLRTLRKLRNNLKVARHFLKV